MASVFTCSMRARSAGVVGVELVGDQELAHVVSLVEVEPAPVDDRVAAQDEADGLEVGQGELRRAA